MVAERTVIVVAGGGRVGVDPDRLPDTVAVIAADVGVAEAHRLGLRVDLLVGDLDSASPEDVRAVERAGGTVRRHPEDKDATDLELALDEALATGTDHILVLAGADGRFDHLLGNALVLGSDRYESVLIDGWFGGAAFHLIRDRRILHGRPGELLTLLPLGGPARGVRTVGLRWPLLDEDLEPGSGRGTSNVFAEPEAVVALREGVLLAVRPDPGPEVRVR
jgi:thiamine pyrophosphokinase